jgi:hypothetical protein
VEVLLGAGADTDEIMGDAIYFAINAGSGEVLQALITAGGDPDTTRGDGKPALWEAVNRGHTDMVKMLINAGANANVVCRESAHVIERGNGVLWRYQSALALARNPCGYYRPPEIVKLLEDAGATYVSYFVREAD